MDGPCYSARFFGPEASSWFFSAEALGTRVAAHFHPSGPTTNTRTPDTEVIDARCGEKVCKVYDVATVTVRAASSRRVHEPGLQRYTTAAAFGRSGRIAAHVRRPQFSQSTDSR